MKLEDWLNEQPSHLTPHELLARLWSRSCAIEAAERKLGDEARERAARLEAALKGLAWNEIDGKCWCRESPERHGMKHSEACLKAKVALAPAPTEEGG